MRQFELKRTLLGADITAQVTLLDDGIHVLLTGGERSHVGAAALAQAGELTGCLSFPGHKEQVVCEQWARSLSAHTGGCAAVACGIHYDNATAEQISEILRVCDGLLYEMLAAIAREEQTRGNIYPCKRIVRAAN